MKYWALVQIFSCVLFSSCTVSISQFHSEGSTDTLDEQQTATPTVSPDITIPALGKLDGRDVGDNYLLI